MINVLFKTKFYIPFFFVQYILFVFAILNPCLYMYFEREENCMTLPQHYQWACGTCSTSTNV